MNWTAQDGPGWFTGGNAGIRALVEQTGWKIIAHNRYWSPHTNYAKQNGGDWDFFIDAAGAGDMAVPLDQAFWVWLLTSSVAEWGLATYEQDWLHNELEGVTALLTNATLARTWLVQMGAGAEAAGVTVQLCMSYPRHALQSVECVAFVPRAIHHAPKKGPPPPAPCERARPHTLAQTHPRASPTQDAHRHAGPRQRRSHAGRGLLDAVEHGLLLAARVGAGIGALQGQLRACATKLA